MVFEILLLVLKFWLRQLAETTGDVKQYAMEKAVNFSELSAAVLQAGSLFE